MSYKKVGGLHFFRFGRFGVSFFIARASRPARAPLSEANAMARDCRISGRLKGAAIALGALMAAALPVFILSL
jgi:hypothetical protein